MLELVIVFYFSLTSFQELRNSIDEHFKYALGGAEFNSQRRSFDSGR